MDINQKLAQAIDQYRLKNLKGALNSISAILKVEPLHQEALLLRAKAYCRLNEMKAGLADFDTLVAAYPSQAEIYAERAVALHINNRNEEALEDFNKALALDPENPYRYASRAFFRDRIGDYQGALEDYEITISLDPDDAIAINNMGLLQEKMGYKERAKATFKRADEIIGYEPQFGKEAKDTENSPAEIKVEKKVPQPTFQNNKSEKKLTLSSYTKTLKKIFVDKKTRSDFGNFISSLFKSKNKAM